MSSTMGIIRIDNKVRWLLLFAAVIMAATAAVVVATVTSAGDDDAARRADGNQVGQGFAGASQSPVVTVNGELVSEAQLQLARDTVNFNVRSMTGSITAAELPAEVVDNLSLRLTAIQTAGVDNVALGSVIVDSALVNAARNAGFTASDEEIDAKVAVHRMSIANGDLPAVEGFASALGDRYWTEYLPGLYEGVVLVEKLRQSVVADAADAADAASVWTAFERETTISATVEIVDSSKIGSATIAGAMEYLDAYWQLPR